MPEIFEISFPLRYYECDILGHLNNASYFKFMQEAAFAASASVGYGRARYTQMDRAWIIHESKINYLKPVYYGQELVIRTWVSDMRRVRSLRQYEFLVGDTLVAQAYTDWVFLDRTSMRPTEIPEEVQMAYLPEKLPQNGQDREKYPRTPIPAAEVFIHPKASNGATSTRGGMSTIPSTCPTSKTAVCRLPQPTTGPGKGWKSIILVSLPASTTSNTKLRRTWTINS